MSDVQKVLDVVDSLSTPEKMTATAAKNFIEEIIGELEMKVDGLNCDLDDDYEDDDVDDYDDDEYDEDDEDYD